MQLTLRDGFPGSQAGFEPGSVAPQAFEVVISASWRIEDMYHDIAVVEQHPLGSVLALSPERFAPDFS